MYGGGEASHVETIIPTPQDAMGQEMISDYSFHTLPIGYKKFLFSYMKVLYRKGNFP